MNNNREFAFMCLELAKLNDESNADIKNIQLISDDSIEVNVYTNNAYNTNDTSYIVSVYADYLYKNNNSSDTDTFTAELFFSVQHEIVTCNKIITDRISVTYLHAINQH